MRSPATESSIAASSSEILTRPVGVTARATSTTRWSGCAARPRGRRGAGSTHCQDAERAAGRRDTWHWGPRVADADILLLGDHGEIQVDEPDLTVPHPEIEHRPFLVELLREAGYTPA